MNTLNQCPCCSEPLLRHARRGRVYWFCLHCHQEMPNLLLAVTSDNKTLNSPERLGKVLDLV
ncbi:MAG: hypothetical protein HC769_12595 [Cyanobacteria bacterium CRU_2_1]|nr:hypothetical protein [Cyanobacteria bacterium RU_5_0]NJR59604.1 hypothetical protein [Cyanobacteria bacterium CRU_2_1]